MASVDTSLLAKLRASTTVDCDTLDVEVAKKLGPFHNCTSNQAIAYFELVKVDESGKQVHEQLIRDSIKDAANLHAQKQHLDVSPEELAVDIMMVRLSLRFTPYLTGYHLVQVNPKLAFSTAKIIANAHRIIALFTHLAPSPAFSAPARVCIKIPSTWEGLQACRTLDAAGIATLGTTLFCLEQAALAAAVNCTYISPYVNELRVHFEPGYVDTAKAFALCGLAQRYFRAHNAKTKCLPASLTSITEVMRLAGADNLTVSPLLLEELAITEAKGWEGEKAIGEVFAVPKEEETKAEGKKGAEVEALVKSGDEAAWRLAFARADKGRCEGKLAEAIHIFCEMQERLEELVRKFQG